MELKGADISRVCKYWGVLSRESGGEVIKYNKRFYRPDIQRVSFLSQSVRMRERLTYRDATRNDMMCR